MSPTPHRHVPRDSTSAARVAPRPVPRDSIHRAPVGAARPVPSDSSPRTTPPAVVAFAALLALGTACGTTGAEPFNYPALARGPGPGPHALGPWQVTLTRADVALGPIFFCATAAASPDLCDVAVAEITAPAVADALAPEYRPLADVDSLPGEVRSAMLDYGVSWPATASEWAPVTDLGHSARFTGTATRGDLGVDFDIIVDLPPPTRGSPTVVGAHAVAPEVPTRLEIDLPVHAWLAGVDWDALAAAGDSAEIRPGDAEHDVVAFAMTTQPPGFRWTDKEP